MNVENDATAGKNHGRVERESNDTVIFISEQGRRIRFRYPGKSLQYPSAAEYQCTQCPVTALMINAQFRVVDPCAGHDCSVDECHSQSTSPAEDDMPVLSPQHSPATTAPASRSLRPMKKAKKVVAKVTYDANGSIQWRSERYTGVTFTFRTKSAVPGRRRYFQCSGCSSKYEKYRDCLKECGIIRRCLIVWDGNIVDFHPDDAGTNQGHLCQQPLLEEKLKRAKASGKNPAATADIAKVADGAKGDTSCLQKASKKKSKKAKV
ncbi:hypothetical protein AAVH_11088 [Aphelenchoides avenae]|nr:hypothetical protein AAVH_11088 [Aphelenchus avenae]